MIALRQELKPIAEARGIKFTYMPLMFKAASLAMQRYPHVTLPSEGPLPLRLALSCR